MFNLGDEMVVEWYEEVPWVLMLNVLAMLLLLVLFFSTIIVSDGEPVLETSNSISSYHHSSPSSQTKTKQLPKTVHGAITLESESSSEEEEGRMKEIEQGESPQTQITTELNYSYSPCHWLGIASKAFLSCFGLHSSSQPSQAKKLRNDPTTKDPQLQNNSNGPKQHHL